MNSPELQDKYQFLFNAIKEGYCVIELIYDDQGLAVDWTYLEANPAFERQTGYRRPVGQKISILQPDLEVSWYERFAQVARTGEAVRFTQYTPAMNCWYDVYARSVGPAGGKQVSLLFTDITSQKESGSEQEYRAIFNAIEEGFSLLEVLFDDAGKAYDILIRDANPAQDRIDGVRAMIGKRVREFLPDIEMKWIERYGQIARSGTSEQFEDWSEANKRWYQVHASRVGGEESHLVAIIYNDITQRKKAEENEQRISKQLKKEAQKLEVTLNTIEDFVFSFNRDYKIIYGNRRMTDLWGLQPGQEVGKDLAELNYPPPLIELLHGYIRRVFATGQMIHDESAYTSPTGVVAHYEYIMNPVFQPDGSVDHIIGSARDITARKQAQHELADFNDRLELEIRSRTTELLDNQQLLRTIIDHSFSHIQVFHAIRDERGRIIDFEWRMVNKPFSDAYGEMAGRRLLAQNPAVVETGIFADMIKVVETGEPIVQEHYYPYEQFDGWFSQVMVKMDDRVIMTTDDITERKKTEAKMRQMEVDQQLEIVRITLSTQEEERRRISENLHNGLGQVLYGIKISLAKLTAKAAKEQPEKYEENRHYTGDLLSEAIRDTRRIAHQLAPTVLEGFGLEPAIRDMCRQMGSQVRFDCKLNLGKQPWEKYLELAIFRILQELIMNVARHAEADQSSVLVTQEGPLIRLQVKDNGHGFDTEKQKRDGIGLASIRSKVKLLNGEFSIGSDKKGTIVNISLPVHAN